jgi:hypothetical protein
MFTRSTGLRFGEPQAPEPLHAAFAGLRAAIAPFAADRHLDTYTEVFWSALHGLVTLSQAGRLRESQASGRVPLLVGQLLAQNAPTAPP